MSTPPRIPGLPDYPELQKRYESAYREARLKSSCRADCETAAVVRRFKQLLDDRRRRDK